MADRAGADGPNAAGIATASIRATPIAFESPFAVRASLAIANKAVTVSRFCYNFTMTIGITGPERKLPRRSAVVGFIIAAVVIGIFLILLGLVSDLLVDWLWFSSIGYLQVF